MATEAVASRQSRRHPERWRIAAAVRALREAQRNEQLEAEPPIPVYRLQYGWGRVGVPGGGEIIVGGLPKKFPRSSKRTRALGFSGRNDRR